MNLFAKLFGGTVIVDNIRSGNLQKIIEFFNATPDLFKKRYEKGMTVLHLSVGYGQKDITSFFLHAGARVNAEDDDGICPLHCAKSVEIALLLINSGADINATDKKGNTPLSLAAEYNSPELARVFIQHGAIVDSKNSAGATPILYCALNDSVETAKVLCEAGANTKILIQGMTLLQLAQAKKSTGIINFLSRGA